MVLVWACGAQILVPTRPRCTTGEGPWFNPDLVGKYYPEKNSFIGKLKPLPFNNSRKSENRVSKSKIEFPALASS